MTPRLALLQLAAVALPVLGAALVAACSGDETNTPSEEPEPRRPPEGAQSIPPTEQRPGDPAEGRRLLLDAPYVSCGLPASLLEGRDTGNYFPILGLPGEAVTLPERDAANAELPYFLTRATAPNGVALVTTNCLTCHASTFDGALIVGLGNANLDTTVDLAEIAALIGSQITDPDELEAFAEWRDRVTTIAPAIAVDTVGVSAADNLALELFGRRDPATMEWREDYQIDVPEGVRPVPIATPPWWRMGKKNAMFYTGAFQGDHTRYMFAASSLCIDDVEDALEIDAYFANVRAYIASIEPPPYPGPVDEGRAAAGERVFVRECSGCHGTYGAEPSYPNLVIPVEAVGTDRMLFDFEELLVDAVGPWISQTVYASSNQFVKTPGYYAPPLDGIWITAPFFHNDSVPTLEAVLDSSIRPTYFQRRRDAADFDHDAVGWTVDVVDQGKVDGDGSVPNRTLYDTTRPGYSNAGHTYGDLLEDEERKALLEYLKTL